MDSVKTPALLPCPFCGGLARELACPGGSWIRCEECKASSDDSNAVVKWSRRASPPLALRWWRSWTKPTILNGPPF